MPRQVLISEMASAPPAAAALAIVGMLVTFGVSLAMIGVAVARRQSATSRSHIAASVPKSTPPDTFGHEMLSSIAAMPARPSSRRVMRDEFVVRPAGDADDDRHAQAGQVRQMMRDERLDAVVVEADRVEHAGGGLDRSPRRVAGPRLLRDRLRQNAAEAAEVDQAFHLAGVAERARRDEDRIRQPQPAELDREIDCSRRCEGRKHYSISIGTDNAGVRHRSTRDCTYCSVRMIADWHAAALS